MRDPVPPSKSSAAYEEAKRPSIHSRAGAGPIPPRVINTTARKARPIRRRLGVGRLARGGETGGGETGEIGGKAESGGGVEEVMRDWRWRQEGRGEVAVGGGRVGRGWVVVGRVRGSAVTAVTDAGKVTVTCATQEI